MRRSWTVLVALSLSVPQGARAWEALQAIPEGAALPEIVGPGPQDGLAGFDFIGVRPSIVGNPREVRPEQYRGVVFLQFRNYTEDGRSKLCTGTLISPRVVLTAGHCLFNLNSAYSQRDYAKHPADIAVWAGVVISSSPDSGDPRSGSVIVSGAQAARWHPEWQGGGSWNALDMGLILLPPGMTDGIEPYGVNRRPPQTGEAGIIVGYGKTGRGKGIIKNMGRTGIRGVNERIVAIGGESSICTGDSGGPLFVDEGGVQSIAGVASRTTFDCSPGAGSTTRVDTQVPWIESVMEEWGKASRPGPGASLPRVMGLKNRMAELTQTLRTPWP